jgi:hypothetical protein
MSQECLQDAQKTVFVMSEMVDNLPLFARLRDASELIKEARQNLSSNHRLHRFQRLGPVPVQGLAQKG